MSKEPNTSCYICGKEFYLKPYRTKRGKYHYCSRNCHYVHKKTLMKGENNRQYGLKGELNSSFKDDYRFSSYGYILVRELLHPFRNYDDMIFLHRLIYEQYLRDYEPASPYLIQVEGFDQFYLDPSVIIHHINGNKLDNNLYNLEVLSLGDHTAHHNMSIQFGRDSLGRFVKKIPEVNCEKENLPSKKYLDDAGHDIKSAEDVTISPNESYLISTQLKMKIPKNHVGLIWSRSGLAVKNNIECGAGCIDATYRGEIKVLLRNFGSEPFIINKGDRIAQMLILPISILKYQEVEEIDSTERGEDGFGSTGK